ncbi:ORC-CDC6 family AAA ATPase [Herbiconiux sp. YIM B11900]|uniref:ORC-CDC6 family AAA ATPase n=1 Tax=Herbiconiux sp. YIM B11900 TaxID=3404131 RepID=UPI003F87E20A
MTNLTCFWHPKLGYHDLTLDDVCVDCGRTMRHPLQHRPVGGLPDYEIIGSIDRGYYSATYIARQGVLGQKVCLKIIPRTIYALRGKDFVEESRQHADVASGTRHLVNIHNAFDAEVMFEGDTEALPCHVAVLDYVDGRSLRSLLDEPKTISARAAAQIATDLLRLLNELENKQVFHNDLHSGNILVQELPPELERGGAIDPFVQVVAVDLGSVLDRSRSDEAKQIADSHQVTEHLMRLALRVVPDPIDAPDVEYRLALALNDIANLLKPETLTQRNPNYTDLIAGIESAFMAASSPWKEPNGGLVRFGDSFNAQTMRPWFVPRLLVDPDGEWQRRIESSGPLVITGMRGCGKTMLLRSLQFHARASTVGQETGAANTPAAVTDALRRDGYVGLYVSCNRLLDGLGRPDGPLHEPHTRLFLSFAREALQAMRHLSEVAGRNALSPVAPRPIASLIGSLISNSGVEDGDNLHVLERRILEMLRSLESGKSDHILSAHPASAMPSLALAVSECADVWTGSRVLFLLDDVSTRHLNEESIRALMSTLMFVNENCAFKITTEAQTLELVLKSPGLVETARSGRDYDTFDLASAIYAKLRDSQGRAGREFVAKVLQQRANLTSSHPDWTPSEIVGDQPLVDIARRIAASTESSPDRKNVYFGMSALAAVCVGDIGDVISIYELILTKAGRVSSVPVPAKYQSSAFQEFCSRRLYQLSRRQGRLKHFADGFAKAAHDLLVQSARRDPARIRDYASVYVRVTTGDTDNQLRQLRELMDAGVFVLTGGPDTPRTKTRDSDPIAQYTLTFRKLLGLASAIGLSQRDRFELSGQNLIDWLDDPQNSSETLKRNLASTADLDPSFPVDIQVLSSPPSIPTLFDGFDARELQELTQSGPSRPTLSEPLPFPSIQELALDQLASLRPHTLVTAAGFEERAFVSTKRLLNEFRPELAVSVTYPLIGYGAQIRDLLNTSEGEVRTVASDQSLTIDTPGVGGIGVVDTTGLSKKFIYHAIRGLLNRDGRVLAVYTEAERYYPLNEEVAMRLGSAAEDDDYARLEACHDILTGETRPYHFIPMHSGDVDDGRRRALLASSSAKHERLFSLLEERDYDHVEILVPSGDSARDDLARLAARVAAQDAHSCNTRQIPSSSPEHALTAIRETYEEYYALSNFNFEVGLTGSKMQAIAIAAASTSLKFSQAWYVQPDHFDTGRFTNGVGRTRVFLIEAATP